MKKYLLFYTLCAIILHASCKQKTIEIDNIAIKRMLEIGLVHEKFYHIYKAINTHKFEIVFNEPYQSTFTIKDYIFYINPNSFKFNKKYLIHAKLDSLAKNEICLKLYYIHFPSNNSVDYIILKFKHIDNTWELMDNSSGIYDGDFNKKPFDSNILVCK